MSKGIMATGIVMLGVLMLLLVNIIQGYSSGDELDYSLLRDTTEAAMLDAIDISYYQTTGLVRMDKEKFAESFVKRFANNVNGDRYYDIRFYDINETPPKVSVKIGSSTVASFAGENFDIKNQIDGIIETKYSDPTTYDKILDNIGSNSSSKPSWYPSYNSTFGDSGDDIDDDDDDSWGDESEDELNITRNDVQTMFNKNKREFYDDDRRLYDIDEFIDIMINLFWEKYSLNSFEEAVIADHCEQIYGKLPKKR